MGTEDCECRWEWYGKEGRAAEESPDARHIVATVFLDPLRQGPPKRDMRKRKKKAKRGTCLSSYLSPIAPGSSSYTRAAQELFVKLRDSEEIQKVASN